MISFKSSSIHTFSGDNNPGILKKLFWLIINLIRNNFFSLNKDLSLKLLYQNTPDISANLKKIDKTFSPSRKLADLYWLSLPTNEQKVGGKPTKSISERLKGKAGRIRSNLMGKRVDF